MWKLLRCTCALIVASSFLALGASAQEEDDDYDPSSFVRTGFYVGAGGTAAFPRWWNRDFTDDLDEEASDLANDNAGMGFATVFVKVGGAELEDTLLGVSGVVGYRAGALVAFEIEGEWLFGSNSSNLDVSARTRLNPDPPPSVEPGAQFLDESTGSHSAKMQELWAVTANLKAYAPLTGRFQPFVKVGLGMQHAKFEYFIETSGLFARNQAQTTTTSADFVLSETKKILDGVLRFGGGIDVYATPNIVAELTASYVVPFSDVGIVNSDYATLQLRLIYRF
jgi:opacity protein-like surface antigen